MVCCSGSIGAALLDTLHVPCFDSVSAHELDARANRIFDVFVREATRTGTAIVNEYLADAPNELRYFPASSEVVEGGVKHYHDGILYKVIRGDNFAVERVYAEAAANEVVQLRKLASAGVSGLHVPSQVVVDVAGFVVVATAPMPITPSSLVHGTGACVCVWYGCALNGVAHVCGCCVPVLCVWPCSATTMDDIRVDDDARQVLGKAANELHLVQPPADAKLTLASSLQVYRGSDSRLYVVCTDTRVACDARIDAGVACMCVSGTFAEAAACFQWKCLLQPCLQSSSLATQPSRYALWPFRRRPRSWKQHCAS